jgi:hypothetical protein
MADTKISAFTAGAPALSTDEVIVARSGGNRRLTLEQVLALRRSPRNLVVNGGGDIAQRGTTQALTTAMAYGSLDRWAFMQVTSANGAATQGGSIEAGFPKSIKIGRTADSALTGIVAACQAVESVDAVRYAGKQITFSFRATAGSTYSAAGGVIAVQVQSGTGTDQTAAQVWSGGWTGQNVFINDATKVINSSTSTRCTYTATVPANCNQLAVSIFYTPVGTAGATDAVWFTDVRLHEGPDITEFFGYRAYAEELALARRYCRVGSIYVPAAYQSLPIDMRAIPTITGGGAGYSSTGTSATTLVHQQTAAALRTLVLTAEI